MVELRSWGEAYNPSFEHSEDTHCPYCYWRLSGLGEKGLLPQGYFTYVVGFSLDAPPSSRQTIVGAFIVSCPACFEKYWFHAGMKHIEICKAVGKWPKD